MKRYLLLVMLCVCVSIGAWASISVWPTNINGKDGYGIFNWENPGELAQFLNGTYTGQVYNGNDLDENWVTNLLPLIEAAEAVKIGGNAESPKEQVSQDDFNAVFASLTNAVYVRMDCCTPATGVTLSFDDLSVASSSLKSVSMPTGVTKEQVEAANKKLLARSPGLDLTVSIAGEIQSNVETHYWYTLPGSTTRIEYTDEVAEGQTSVHVENYEVMADLTLEEGYPKYSYVNTLTEETEYFNENDLQEGVGDWESNTWIPKYAPNPIHVKVKEVTEATGWKCLINGTWYSVGWDAVAQGYTYEKDGKTYIREGAWIAGYNANAPSDCEFEVEYTTSIKYTWNGQDYAYTGDYDEDTMIGSVANPSNNYTYKFPYTKEYKYTYTDKDGNPATLTTQNTPDEDGKILIDTYTGDLDLDETEEIVNSLVVDGAVACVNTPGSLPNAKAYMFGTGDQLRAYQSAKEITVVGNVNNDDLTHINNDNFGQSELVDLSEVTVAEGSSITKIVQQNTTYNNRTAFIVPKPTPAEYYVLENFDDYNSFEYLTFAYYDTNADGTLNKNHLNICSNTNNGPTVIDNYSRVVKNDALSSVTFMPYYKADGTFDSYMSWNAAMMTQTSQLEARNINFQFVTINEASCDYSGLSENTHYVHVPLNGHYYIETDYTYSDNIWVAGAYVAAPDGSGANQGASTAEGYGTKYAHNKADLTPTTGTNITYVRVPGTLDGAETFLTDVMKHAETFVVTGTVNNDDLATMKHPHATTVDMVTATLAEGADIMNYKNAYVEYLALPDGQAGAITANSPTDFSFKPVQGTEGETTVTYFNNLKCVAAWNPTENKLVVHSTKNLGSDGKQINSVAKVTSFIRPRTDRSSSNFCYKLENVVMSGYYNQEDISVDNTRANAGLNSASVKNADFENAVFPTQTDMVFTQTTANGGAGWGGASLANMVLPNNAEMTLVPAHCLDGAQITEICVPYYYTHIDNAAFFGTLLEHLTTTDANGALVDNGARTYTFSKNLEEIGTDPGYNDDGSPISLEQNVFPQNRGVTDVYAMAHKVPKCYAGVFPANMTYGWGGIRGGDFPYCREKYDNSTDGSEIITILHFPDEASFNAATDKEDNYDLMKKLYTDVNKVYTKKDQTGAVDANGDPIAWPTFPELRRAYNQATDGITWYDWTTATDGNGDVLGFEIPTAKDGVTPGTGENSYPFKGYEGWHQIVLTMATYVEPDKTVIDEVITNNYVQGGWYTICIPYSLTIDMITEMLGVPASVEGKVENYLNGKLVEREKLPDLRMLQTVTRTPATADKPTNKVLMKFTNNLLEDATMPLFWNINFENPLKSDYAGTGSTDKGERIAIKGGYPYLIRPYLPAGEDVKNVGKYVMTRFAEVLSQRQDLSCLYDDNCYQDLGEYTTENKTGRFYKPFESHKIQAKWDDQDASTPAYRTHSDGKKYYYTFVGQFWDQKLPRYSFYMVENSDNVNGKFYRLASEKEYKWNKYKCIIMVTPEIADTEISGRSYLFTNSGKYRNAADSQYPASTGTDSDGGYMFDGLLRIGFLNGLDDSDFTEAAGAKYEIAFDDFIQEIEDDEVSVTAIESLDGSTVYTPTVEKIYNMAGQYVGSSVDGLGKGMYIVNGKKVVIK